MGSYLDKPETTKKSAFDENNYLEIGSSSMQGWRINQEDAHNAIPQLSEYASFFAVYDGHGGSEVAEYCSMKLPDFLKQLEAFKNGNYEEALKEAFMGFDKTLLEDKVSEELKQLAKKNPDFEDSEMDEIEEDETAEEIINLHQEAAMPLAEVLEKYKGNVEKIHTRIQSAQRIISFQNKTPNDAGPSSSSGGSSNSTSPSKQATNESNFSTTQPASDNEVSSSSGKTNSDDAEKDEPSSSNSQSNNNQTPPDSTLATIPPSSSTNENNCSNEPKNTKSSNEMDSSESSSNGATVTESNKGTENNPSSDDAISSTRENGEVGSCSSTTTKNTKQVKTNVDLKKTEQSDDTESDDELDETYKESPKKKTKAIGDSTDEDEEEEEDDEEVYDENEEEELSEEISGEEDDDEDGLDDAFINNMETGPAKASGCTAVVALLVDRDLYVANAGDSRCIVCRSGKVIEMSFDHKPEDQIEFQRIRKAGGRVSMDGRVNGGLNLSRAIGDHAYKMNKELPAEEQMITAMPDLKRITLNEDDEFMVLACDGIWNYMSNEEVVGFVKHRIDAGKLSLTQICEELFHNCLAPNTLGDGTGCDNMTAIIVKFKSALFQLPISKDVSNTDTECNAHKRVHEDDAEEIVAEPSDIKKQKLDDDLTPSTVDTSS